VILHENTVVLKGPQTTKCQVEMMAEICIFTLNFCGFSLRQMKFNFTFFNARFQFINEPQEQLFTTL